MAFNTLLTVSSLLAAGAYAQQVGTSTAEKHPKITINKCTSSGCTQTQNSIVLDANWRWLHNVGGYTNCYTGQAFDSTLCPSNTACASNCAVDGAEYGSTYGKILAMRGANYFEVLKLTHALRNLN
jgi:cellulose 1,4-beta-cellobiosidase